MYTNFIILYNDRRLLLHIFYDCIGITHSEWACEQNAARWIWFCRNTRLSSSTLIPISFCVRNTTHRMSMMLNFRFVNTFQMSFFILDSSVLCGFRPTRIFSNASLFTCSSPMFCMPRCCWANIRWFATKILLRLWDWAEIDKTRLWYRRDKPESMP